MEPKALTCRHFVRYFGERHSIIYQSSRIYLATMKNQIESFFPPWCPATDETKVQKTVMVFFRNSLRMCAANVQHIVRSPSADRFAWCILSPRKGVNFWKPNRTGVYYSAPCAWKMSAPEPGPATSMSEALLPSDQAAMASATAASAAAMATAAATAAAGAAGFGMPSSC